MSSGSACFLERVTKACDVVKGRGQHALATWGLQTHFRGLEKISPVSKCCVRRPLRAAVEHGQGLVKAVFSLSLLSEGVIWYNYSHLIQAFMLKQIIEEA